MNEPVSVYSEEDVITLAGIADPAFDWSMPDDAVADREIKQAFSGTDDSQIKILLSHRPELINIYSANGIDLVLTGTRRSDKAAFHRTALFPVAGFAPEIHVRPLC